MKDKEDEKFRNLIIFGFWGTNEEYGKVAPFVLIAAIVIVVLLLIFGCTSNNEGYQYPKSTPPVERERIEGIYNSSHLYYEIIKVDGHLYLANQKGGIVHMESCPCKVK